MTVEIREVEDERWDRYVERSAATVFHRSGALDAIRGETGDALHRLVGYRGEEPVGILPLFVRTVAGTTVAFSPPPDLLLPYLGPALLTPPGCKPSKAERRHGVFVDAATEWLHRVYGPAYVHLRSGTRYTDPRPLSWNGFRIRPKHTYSLDTTRSREELLSTFSSDARRNVRGDEDVDCRIEVGDREAIRAIVEQVAARYRDQGESYPLDPGFVTALYDGLTPERFRPYACYRDGELIGGMLAPRDDRTVYRWQGGAKPDVELPVNDLLDWRIITDAVDDGLAEYDLVDADTRRLNGYKAKFNPALRPYYEMEWGRAHTRLLAGAYRRLRY
ncbi:GNAT family N-acetyltransferase [Natronorarus salvus]|uniref:GNAT family N-acetyltransferase n=1 Tax=Natronorarus salvus TaxID=3117733 RepID=UPI002F26DDD0